MKVRLIVWVCFFVFPSLYARSSDGQFELKLDGPVDFVSISDLNGDGLDDLLVLFNQEDPINLRSSRKLRCFTGEKEGPPRFVNEIQLNHSEILFDIADLDSNGIRELLFLCPDGLFRQSWTDTSRIRLVHAESVLPAPDLHRLSRYPLSNDLDGDGYPELLIPHTNHLAVYRRLSGEYFPVCKLWIQPCYELETDGPPALTIQLPQIKMADFNNDSRQDLLVIQGDQADVFLMFGFSRSAGLTGLVPPNFRFEFGGRRITRSSLESLAPVHSSLEAVDLNRDGAVDFVMTLASRAGFTSSLSQIHVYLNHYGRIPKQPDFVFTADNFNGEHLLHDFNQDGFLDIALFHFRIGYSMAARLLLTRKIKHEYEFYLLNPENGYDPEPDARLSVSKNPLIRDISSSIFGAFFPCDFNGDGLTDILTAVDRESWSVFFGDSEKIYSKKKHFSFNVPLTHYIKTGDLNGDGASDCVMWYPNAAKLEHAIRIIPGRKAVP